LDPRAWIEKDGFAVVDGALSACEVDAVLRDLEPLDSALLAAARGGLRDVLRSSTAVRQLVVHPAIRHAVEPVLGIGAFAVRGILFDKHREANWRVPWHQDLTIAVREMVPTDGYGPWSVKAGVQHVQPPASVLERMITVRVHLDDCGASNGPLRILAGSHRAGRLSADDVAAAAAAHSAVTCSVGRGGLLVMRPLSVHASSSSTDPVRRRVLHLDFACCDLADGLEWADRWPCLP